MPNKYEGIIINASDALWGGLVKSCHSESYIDGSTYHNNWWYAIGSYYDYAWSGGVPGPNGIVVRQIQLWLATDASKFTFY